MLEALSQSTIARPERVTPMAFTVHYGQHLIGIARARGAEEAMHVIEALFLGDIEPERMNARRATAEEEERFSAALSECGEDAIAGIVV